MEHFKYYANSGIVEPGKVVSVVCDGKEAWKGLTEDMAKLDAIYDFVKFDNTLSESTEFGAPDYRIIATLKESRLPVDKKKDPEFGLPEKEKFPLYDKEHVLSAMRFFNYVDAEDESRLAGAIIAKMKEYGIPFSKIGDDNKLRKYIPEEEHAAAEPEEKDYTDDELKQALKESGFDDSECNVSTLREGLETGEYVIAGGADATLDEGARETERMEKYMNHKIYRAAGKVDAAGFVGWSGLGWLLGGPVGAIIAACLANNHNRNRDDFENDICDMVDSDDEAQRILREIREEVAKPRNQMYKSKLKDLKRQFTDVVARLKRELKKSNDDAMRARRISLKEMDDTSIGKAFLENVFEASNSTRLIRSGKFRNYIPEEEREIISEGKLTDREIDNHDAANDEPKKKEDATKYKIAVRGTDGNMKYAASLTRKKTAIIDGEEHPLNDAGEVIDDILDEDKKLDPKEIERRKKIEEYQRKWQLRDKQTALMNSPDLRKLYVSGDTSALKRVQNDFHLTDDQLEKAQRDLERYSPSVKTEANEYEKSQSSSAGIHDYGNKK